MNQCGEMVYFTNRICLLKEGSQRTLYTNNVGGIYTDRAPLEQAQCSGNEQIGFSQESLSQRGYIICVDTSFYQKHNPEQYQPLE